MRQTEQAKAIREMAGGSPGPGAHIPALEFVTGGYTEGYDGEHQDRPPALACAVGAPGGAGVRPHADHSAARRRLPQLVAIAAVRLAGGGLGATPQSGIPAARHQFLGDVPVVAGG